MVKSVSEVVKLPGGGGGLTVENTWDMTPQLGDAVPVPAYDSGGTSAIVDANTQTLTPGTLVPGGGGFIATARSERLAELSGSAKIVKHQGDAGDNLDLLLFSFGPVGMSMSDFIDRFNAPQPGDYLMMIQFPAGGNELYLAVVEDGVALSSQTVTISTVPGDNIFFTMDKVNGQVLYQINDGSVSSGVLGTANLAAFPESDIVYGMVFTSATPTLQAGNTAFDMSSTEQGLTPLKAASDAAPPTDVKDAIAYEVITEGPYKGQRGYPGDIAFFYNNTQKVRFIRARDPNEVQKELTVEISKAVEDPLDILLRDRVLLSDVPRNSPGSLMAGEAYGLEKGKGVIVGPSPSSEFSNFIPGNIAYYTGTGWEQYDINTSTNSNSNSKGTDCGGWIVYDALAGGGYSGFFRMLAKKSTGSSAGDYLELDTPTALLDRNWVVQFDSTSVGFRNIKPEDVSNIAGTGSFTVYLNSDKPQVFILSSTAAEQAISLSDNLSVGKVVDGTVFFINTSGVDKALTYGGENYINLSATAPYNTKGFHVSIVNYNRGGTPNSSDVYTVFTPMEQEEAGDQYITMTEGGTGTIAPKSNVTLTGDVTNYTLTLPAYAPDNRRTVIRTDGGSVENITIQPPFSKTISGVIPSGMVDGQVIEFEYTQAGGKWRVVATANHASDSGVNRLSTTSEPAKAGVVYSSDTATPLSVTLGSPGLSNGQSLWLWWDPQGGPAIVDSAATSVSIDGLATGTQPSIKPERPGEIIKLTCVDEAGPAYISERINSSYLPFNILTSADDIDTLLTEGVYYLEGNPGIPTTLDPVDGILEVFSDAQDRDPKTTNLDVFVIQKLTSYDGKVSIRQLKGSGTGTTWYGWQSHSRVVDQSLSTLTRVQETTRALTRGGLFSNDAGTVKRTTPDLLRKRRVEFPSFTGDVVAVSKDGRLVAYTTAGATSTELRIYDFVNGTDKLVHENPNAFNNVVFAFDKIYFDVNTAQRLAYASVSFTESSNLLLVGAVTEIVDAAIYSQINDLIADEANGRLIASTTTDATPTSARAVIEVTQGNAVSAIFTPTSGEVISLALSADGAHLACGKNDNVVSIRSPDTGTELSNFTGTAAIVDMVYRPGPAAMDDRQLAITYSATASFEFRDGAGTYSVITGTPASGTGSAVPAVTYSPDGQYVALEGSSVYDTDDWSQYTGVPTLPAPVWWIED